MPVNRVRPAARREPTSDAHPPRGRARPPRGTLWAVGLWLLALGPVGPARGPSVPLPLVSPTTPAPTDSSPPPAPRTPGPGPLLNACGAATRPAYWLQQLRRRDPAARARAARALGELRDPAALPALLEAANDGDPAVRLAVIEALGRFGDHAAVVVPTLRRLEQDRDPRVAAEAARGLNRLRGSRRP